MSDISIIMTCPRGLEDVLCQEVQTLLGRTANKVDGMVSVTGSFDDVYRLNLHLRTASRVSILLKRGRISSEDDIYRLAKSIDWDTWFTPQETIKVRIEGRNVQFRSLNFLALKVKDGVCDAFREKYDIRPSVDKEQPDVQIYTYVNDKEAFIYLDTSGEALFKRNWRDDTAEAPIRENLAAGMLLLAGFDGSQAFFDPMCGSGTIAIEAAYIAMNRAPGLLRSFGFERLIPFNRDKWEAIREKAQDAVISLRHPIFARDKNAPVIKKALINARRAKLDDVIRFSTGTFTESEAPASEGLIITNPPYGMRLGELVLIQRHYPLWASTLKQNYTGWTAGFITSDLELPKLMRLSTKRKIPLYNGKIECRLFLFDMVKGSHRKTKPHSDPLKTRSDTQHQQK